MVNYSRDHWVEHIAQKDDLSYTMNYTLVKVAQLIKPYCDGTTTHKGVEVEMLINQAKRYSLSYYWDK